MTVALDDLKVDWNLLSRCADIVLAAVEVGPSGPKIRELTGIPHSVINNASYYLRQKGIWWGNNKRWGVTYEWWDKYEAGEEAGIRGFWNTVGLAAGHKTDHLPLNQLSQLLGISEAERRQSVPQAVKARNELRRQRWVEHVRVVRERSTMARQAERQRRLERQQQERVRERWAAARRAARRRKRLEQIKAQKIAAALVLRQQQRRERQLNTFNRLAIKSARSLDFIYENGGTFADFASPLEEDDFVESVAMEWDYYQLCISICESYQSLQPIPNTPPDQGDRLMRPDRRMPGGAFAGFGRNDKLARRSEFMATFNKGVRTFHDERDDTTQRHIAERDGLRREQLRRDGVLVE